MPFPQHEHRRSASDRASTGSCDPVIEFRDLRKQYGETLALRGISFTATPGRVTGLAGPNGSGKTTALRILLGLATPTGGTAHISGRAYRDLPAARRTVGAVLDPSAAHPGRTARSHLRLVADGAGVSAVRVENALRTVSLAEAADRRIAGFSLGMRARLALAGALVGDPAVLVLDEPANGLDPIGVHWLRQTLRGLAAEGRTVLVSSHQLAELAQTVDDAVILAHGEVRYAGPLAGLTATDASLEDAFLRLSADQDQPFAPEVAR